MLCLFFGHAPSSVPAHLKEQMKDDNFECRRCGALIEWKDQPRAIRAMRDEYLRRLARNI